ncbi:hypothetical protein GCM10009534_46730 [Kribbella sandramycini]
MLVTVTGLSGWTDVAPLAGTTATLAADGFSDGFVDSLGFADELDPPLLCVVLDDGCPPAPGSLSLHAVPASSITQIPVTARPCFLLTIPQYSPALVDRRPA